MNQISYQAGGPLLADSSVYILREADEKAAAHLHRMEYVTLVEPRQHGKSSLINHLIGRFPSEEYVFAMRDLMAAKSSATSLAEWYTSLGKWILRQLRFIPRDQRPDAPTDSASWEDFLADIAESARDADKNVVIVLDEIGAMPSEWATDFFSVIRSVYTSRQSLPFWRHLTFVIAGAFDPKELIQDDTISNFNVDQRIPLDDFGLPRVKQLVAHLGLSGELTEAVARRIHYWTDGQPYLCQLLCLRLAERRELLTKCPTDGLVDEAVERFFRDDTHHLVRVRDLARNPDLLGYTRRIAVEPGSRFNAGLNDRHFYLAHINGVIKAGSDGRCQIRNRIYERALAEIAREQVQGGPDEPKLPLELRDQGVRFLFDIGRWAASELGERWKLAYQKRGEEEATKIDLSEPKEQVDRASEALLQEVAAERGVVEVERVLDLIERKRALILEWKESKVDNEEEYNRERISRSALRLLQGELDQKIAQTIAEIEADLGELGVRVRRIDSADS